MDGVVVTLFLVGLRNHREFVGKHERARLPLVDVGTGRGIGVELGTVGNG
jgi:hypothetical protein